MMSFKNPRNKSKTAERPEGSDAHRRDDLEQRLTDKAGDGWKAPIYREARTVDLDLKRLQENRVVCQFADAPEVDFYKVLRTQIQHRTRDKGWNTIMITSVNPGEGKTLTSINLSLTFAKEFNQTVLLVDADLMRQNVHKYLGFESERGLIDYLVNDQPLKDFIVWPGIDKLTLISGGRTIYDSSELLGSPRMKALIQDMKSRYPDRYVFFDVPPLLGGADAIVLAPLVDCVIMVVAEGRTSTQDIKKALQFIPREKFLGFVLNRQTSPMRNYYYAYKTANGIGGYKPRK
jgi:non-specific protein-tyrosine kinase